MKRRDFFKAAGGLAAVGAVPAVAAEPKHGSVKLFIGRNYDSRKHEWFDDWQEVSLDTPLERQFKDARLAQVRRVWSSQMEA